jgi:hypothetical protein
MAPKGSAGSCCFQQVKPLGITLGSLPSLFMAVPFLVAATASGPKYFTTWALYLHAFVFIVIFIVRNIPRHKELLANIFAWGFASGLTLSLSVATTSLFLLMNSWNDVYDEFCRPGGGGDPVTKCKLLAVEFTIAHYVPPILYLLFIFLENEAGAHHADSSTRLAQTGRYFYISHLALTSSVPSAFYNVFFDVDVVYGKNSAFPTLAIYAATTFCASALCSFVFVNKQNS